MASGSKAELERERRALLDAAAAVIAEKGFARATVEDVAARAKLGAIVFYTHFQGMGAMLRALSARFVEQMVGVTDQSTRSGIWKGAPARDVVEVAVRTILDVVIEQKALVRAFLSHGATDEALAMDLRKVGTHLSQRLGATLAECTNVPARPSRSIAFSLLMAVALAHHHVLVGDAWSGVSFSKEQLTEEAVRAVCAYLGLEPTIGFLDNPNAPDLAQTAVSEAVIPDDAPTDVVEAVKTAEVETVPAARSGSRSGKRK